MIISATFILFCFEYAVFFIHRRIVFVKIGDAIQ